MTIQERVTNGEVLGVIVKNSSFSFYMAQSSWFVMNYEKYYPAEMEVRDRAGRYGGPLFREGLRLIDSNNSDLYLSVMEDNRVTLNDLRKYISYEPLPIIFLIDFDNKRYISWFYDIDYEEYIPQNWEGTLDNPLSYLPDEIKQIWEE